MVDFVGDYRTKKLLAEQLRGRQKMMQEAAGAPVNAIVTQGQGAAPTQVQANPWAAIANLGNAYFAGQAGKKAEAADLDAETARMDALNEMMGQTGPDGKPKKMDVAQLMKLSQLGLPDQVVKKLVPDEPAFGALAQAQATKAGRRLAVSMGYMTQEEADKADKDDEIKLQNDLDQYEKKKEIDARYEYHAPTQGRQPTEMELYLKASPEQRALMEQYKGIGKGGAKGGKGGDPVANAEAMNTQLDEAERLINDPKNANMFGWGQRLVGAAIDWKNANPGSAVPLLANTVAGPMESPGAASLRRLGTEQSFARVKELYPASNTDIALARSLSANINQSKEAAQAYVNQMRLMQAKYPKAFQTERIPRGGPGQADGEGVGADADGGWSLEE